MNEIAFMLYLETWLKEDESLLDMPVEEIRHFGKRWLKEWLPQDFYHSGDCTKEPWPCIKCQFNRIIQKADEIKDALYSY